MKPARLLGILFMVTVLVGMFAVIGFSVFGFGFGMKRAFHHDSGTAVAQSHTNLKTAYKSVSVSGPIDLEWVRDGKPSFDVSGSKELMNRLRYEVKGDNIDFHLKPGFSFHGNIKVTLHGPQPTSVAMAGSGDAVLEGLRDGGFEATLAGSGDMKLGGSVKGLTITVAGSGDVDAMNLASDDATVTISGSGNVDVNPRLDLTAVIMGSGDIGYRGDPKITKTIMGSGDVEKKD